MTDLEQRTAPMLVGLLLAALSIAGCATDASSQPPLPRSAAEGDVKSEAVDGADTSTQDDANASIAANVPSTNIVMVSLPDVLAQREPRQAKDVATQRGYDNQPAFAPDGRSLLYSRIADGRQADVYRYAIGTGKTTQVTATPESEYSPTPLARGAFTTVQVALDGVQRLVLYGADGQPSRIVRGDVTGVGYHRWLRHDKLAVFIVDDPLRLEVIDPMGSQRTTVATNIGRALNRTVNGNLAFVAEDADGVGRLYEYDLKTAQTRALAALPGEGQDVVWLVDDTALMANGRTLYRWLREGDRWVEWMNLARSVHGDITRMAVDPAGQWLALVVGESE